MLRTFLFLLLNLAIGFTISAQCLDVDRNVTHPTCGMEDGMIELTPQNGVPPYQYEWIGGSTQTNGAYTVTNLAIGWHAITVTDVNNCSAVKSSILTQGDFQIDAFTNVTTCQGGCAQMFVAAGGGCMPYTYQWSGPNGYSAIGNTPLACDPGTYSVTGTDCDGCQSIISNITVSNTSSGFGIDILNVDNASCSGDCDGAIDIDIIGGIFPFSFTWSNGATTEDLTGLCAGIYDVTVSDDDGLGCFMVTGIVVENTSGTFTVEISDIQNETCGNCEGAIDILVNGGAPPYDFIWSNGQTTEDITGLCEGEYTATVSDATGCFIETSVGVENNSSTFTVDLSNVQNETCGNCEGAIDILVSGGTLPYEFIWSNGQTTEDPTGLCEGDYTATITDATGCFIELNIPVESDSQNPFTVSLFDFEICEGDCFVAEAEIVGVANGLAFEWIDPTGVVFANTQTVTICTPGTYTVNVVNQDGCSASAVTNLTVIPQLSLSASLVEPETSAGNCDGSIFLNVAGGQAPYFFQWQPNGEVDQDLIGVCCAGDYTVFVTDIVGCIAELTVIVPNGSLEVDAFVLDPDCPEDCSGEIEAFVNGGTPPFEYFWSTGQIGATITDLCIGNYSVTITDALGAIGTADASVVNISPLSFETITTNASCDSGGTLVFNVLEGSGVYNYFVNGFQVGINTATDLDQGEVTASVTDLTSGCTIEQIVTIDGPFDVLISDTAASCDMSDGTATATVPGGTSTYSYLWSNGDTNATATGLAIGGYSVTVTDEVNGCESHENVLIVEADGCYVTISGYVIVDNDLDCISNADTDSIPNILISLDENEYTYTDVNGYFEFQTAPGNHTLYYLTESLLYEPLCIAPIDVSVPNFGDVSDGNNFFVYENDITDLKLYITKTPIRPGFNHYVTSNVYNYGNQIINGTYTLVHDPNQTFIVSQPPATNYNESTRTITWDYNNLDPLENFVFLAQFNVPSSISLGTEIEVNGNVDPTTGDIDPDNNVATCISEVVGSYDPNDKIAMHDGEVWGSDPNVVWWGSTDLLTYRVRFQNTGTDTAFTVVIEDELDEVIDIRDITPGPSSHGYELDVRDGKTLVFTFDNILLPDSTTNEAESHGYVFFDVNVDINTTNVQEGDDILNDAAIFFDYNSPIITNEVLTIFDYWLSTNEVDEMSNIELSPNPAQQFTTLIYKLKEDANIKIELLDITGKLVHTIQSAQPKSVGEHNMQINTMSLNNGTYFIRMNVNNKLISRKLVVIN